MAITVDTNFPSGNGLIERIEDGHIYLRPDLRDTEGPWFWWHIRVTGCADQPITVHPLEEHCLTARGACWSPNGLDDWQWVSDTCRHHCCESTANWVLEGFVEGLMEHPLVKVIAAFDLHCPWVRYENSERLYLVGSPVDSV